MIVDEVQHVPNLTSYMQGMVDEDQRPAQFVLTGSQNFTLAQSVSQSLAGRSAIFHLLPLSIQELRSSGHLMDEYAPWVYRGFYPRLYDQDLSHDAWLPDYIQNYLERDVRQITQVQDLTIFQIFLKLCAGRTGQLLNMAALANEVGVDVKTIKSWVSVLEASYIVFLLRPHYRNYGKRVVKTPKLYFYDTGLACSLLGIKSAEQLVSHYLKGELFESLIIAELQKQQYNKGQRPTDYFWRDNTGHEVDFLSESGEGIKIAEIKSGKTIRPEFFRGLDFYQKMATSEAASYLIYGGDTSQNRSNYTYSPGPTVLISFPKNLTKVSFLPDLHHPPPPVLIFLCQEIITRMSVLILLIGVSLTVALGFLLAFLWASSSGQYDDDYTPSVMDHFARESDTLYQASQEGRLHRNFMGYTTQATKLLIGLGASAISDTWTAFGQNAKTIEAYIAHLEEHLAVRRGHVLTEEDLLLREHILNLMCQLRTH